jgi:hypothetical protein
VQNENFKKAAVLVIAFNRPDFLTLALKTIPQDGRSVYIAIDGARNSTEKFAVSQSNLIAENYKKTVTNSNVAVRSSIANQGCKYGVFNAIDWAFKFEDALIIMEDDISPHPQFYDFCDQGLTIFAESENIWQLNGWTPLNENLHSNISFYQTRHAHIWGWATWKNRWEKFDLELKNWQDQNFNQLPIFKNVDLHKNFDFFWNRTLTACANGEIDTWDSQWLYSMWSNESYAISPSSRLCGNIGFDSRATHTPTSGGELFSKMPNPNVFFLPKDLAGFDSTLQYDVIHDLECYKLDDIKSEVNSQHSLGLIRLLISKALSIIRN